MNAIINILIVEDELINMMSIKKMLDKEYTVFTARSGEAAVISAKENKIDIILMDINLKGGIDGIEAVSQIKEIEGNNNLPIVAMTAYAFPGEKERFFNSGFTHYLSKPFDSIQLCELVNEIALSFSS